MNGLPTAVLAMLFVALGLTFLVASARRNVAAVVNAGASLAVALLSVSLAAGLRVPWNATVLTPWFPIWVTAAGLLHSVGMLGPYDSLWWWDHLTHTVSATLVAALLYAGVVVAAETTPASPSPTIIALTTVGYTLVLGVLWEVLELGARAVGDLFDVEPVLVHYGWRDTALDVAFDLAGALLVVALDVRLFVDFVSRYPEVVRALLG